MANSLPKTDLTDVEAERGFAVRPTVSGRFVDLYVALIGVPTGEYHCSFENNVEELDNLMATLKEYRDSLL